MKTPLSFTGILLLLVVLMFPCTSKAQSDATENVLALTIINPGFSYETKTGHRQTLYLSAFMSLGASIGYSSSQGTLFNIEPNPAFKAQYRFYYNFERRLAKNKRTAKNSANYFALEARTVVSSENIGSFDYVAEKRRPVNSIAVLWGLQRNMSKRFNLNFSAGGGMMWARTHYTVDGRTEKETYSAFTVPVSLSLGIWLGKR